MKGSKTISGTMMVSHSKFFKGKFPVTTGWSKVFVSKDFFVSRISELNSISKGQPIPLDQLYLLVP